jgi:hypothetical protein
VRNPASFSFAMVLCMMELVERVELEGRSGAGTDVSVPDRPSKYREHARRARELAGAAASEQERALFEKMAEHWHALADIFDRLTPRKPGA